MRDQLKQEFTRRITTANKSELVVILFDMFNQYVSDAKECISLKAFNDMKTDIRKARSVVSELINGLDMQYELSSNLYSLYRYVDRQLITADIRRNSELLDEALKVMNSLGNSFRTIAKQDDSTPLMQNSEPVYAGITYGKNDINENYGAGSNRGFLA